MRQYSGSEALFDDRYAAKATADFLSDETFFEAVRAFATCSYNRKLKNSGKTFFVDKTPRYFHILSFLDRLFPRAAKIWLKRNPLDVVASYKRSWHFKVADLMGGEVTPASYDFAFGLFELAKFFREDNPLCYEVKYEDLVASPDEVVSSLTRFLGLPYDASMLSYAENSTLVEAHQRSAFGDKGALVTNTLHTLSVGAWQRGLPPDEVQIILDFLGTEIFLRMGYSATIDLLCERGIRVPDEETASNRRREFLAKAPSARVESELSEMRRQLQMMTLAAEERLAELQSKEEQIQLLAAKLKSDREQSV